MATNATTSTDEAPEVFYRPTVSGTQADAATRVLRDWLENIADGDEPEDAQERDDVRAFIAAVDDADVVR